MVFVDLSPVICHEMTTYFIISLIPLENRQLFALIARLQSTIYDLTYTGLHHTVLQQCVHPTSYKKTDKLTCLGLIHLFIVIIYCTVSTTIHVWAHIAHNMDDQLQLCPVSV